MNIVNIRILDFLMMYNDQLICFCLMSRQDCDKETCYQLFASNNYLLDMTPGQWTLSLILWSSKIDQKMIRCVLIFDYQILLSKFTFMVSDAFF